MGDQLSRVQNGQLHTGIHDLSKDALFQIANHLYTDDIQNFASVHPPVADTMGDLVDSFAFNTHEITEDEFIKDTRAHAFVSTLIVTIQQKWPEMDTQHNYQTYFPRLQHLVLKSWPVTEKMSNTRTLWTSFMKPLTDWSAVLRSLDATDIVRGHGEQVGRILTQMVMHSTQLEHLKIKVDFLANFCNVFPNPDPDPNAVVPPIQISNIRSITVLVNPWQKCSQRWFDWLWRWATTNIIDPKGRTLHLKIPEWNSLVHSCIDFRLRGIELTDVNAIQGAGLDRHHFEETLDSLLVTNMGELSHHRSGLTSFVLTVHGCAHTNGNGLSDDDLLLVERVNGWKNTLECFIVASTRVTLNFTFPVSANRIEKPLLDKLMLYTTTRAETIVINITIPSERADHGPLEETIKSFYRNLHSANRRTFGSVQLSVNKNQTGSYHRATQ